MLRTDLVPSRHLRNNRSRAIRLRDNPALLFLGPATPAANTSPDFNTPKRPPRIVKYIVDHICEPISPNRSTSDELSAPPLGAVKTPLSENWCLGRLDWCLSRRRLVPNDGSEPP